MKSIYQAYVLVAATIIFFSSLFLLQGPTRTANLIIITPLLALAWTNFTNPSKTSESIWSLRMLIVVFCLAALGLITSALAVKPEAPVCPPVPEPSPSLCPEPSPIAIEPNPSFPPIVGQVTITNPNNPLYQQTFPYTDFNDGEFLIVISATESGWVKLEDVIP